MKKISLMSFVLTFAMLANLAFAQFNIPPQSDIQALVSNLLKLPQEYLQGANFIWYLLVPFIAIWTITLGFLRTLRIFPNQRNLELIISFTMAFATLPTGAFTSIVNLLLGISGTVATLAFFIMFIVGVFLYSRGWTGSMWEVRGVENKIRSLRSRQRELDDKIAGANPDTERDLIEGWKQERRAISDQMTKLKSQLDKASSERSRQYE